MTNSHIIEIFTLTQVNSRTTKQSYPRKQ